MDLQVKPPCCGVATNTVIKYIIMRHSIQRNNNVIIDQWFSHCGMTQVRVLFFIFYIRVVLAFVRVHGKIKRTLHIKIVFHKTVVELTTIKCIAFHGQKIVNRFVDMSEYYNVCTVINLSVHINCIRFRVTCT